MKQKNMEGHLARMGDMCVDSFIWEPAGNTLLGTPNFGCEDNIQMDSINPYPANVENRVSS